MSEEDINTVSDATDPNNDLVSSEFEETAKPDDLPSSEIDASAANDATIDDEMHHKAAAVTLTLNYPLAKEPGFEMLSPSDVDEMSGDNGAKSGASSIGSFADVSSLPDSPGVEMTMEHSDIKKLLQEAGKESGESSTETDEQSPPMARNRKLEDHTAALNEGLTTLENKGINQTQTVPEIMSCLESASQDFSKIPDADATLFSSITYLGSSTVDAPVSDVELKRTMKILKEQSRVSVDVVLSVGSSYDGNVKLIDPENKSVMATYQLQKILFCGRGNEESEEEDCFAFNTCHGTADVFHCHVFRCLQEDAAAKVLTRFAQSFKIKLPSTEPVESGLVYKFDLTLEMVEDDGKGMFTSVPRDKTCFKLRRDVQKQIIISLHQLSNRLVIIERCFGLLICPGRNVTHADMNLLEKVTMASNDNGRTYIISGNWDPEREDTLVLNTETKKDFVVPMTVALDCVVSGISEPIRFIKEVGVKVYPSNERFWNPSRPKIKEQYILELKLAQDDCEDEKSYEVVSLRTVKEIMTASQIENNEDDNGEEEEEDDDEPLMSGSGQVARECSEEQLDSWSEVMTKWKDVNTRPKQITTLIRKQGVPEPLRAKVWQMLVGLEDNNYLIQSYKDLIRQESPTEQVILWDIHRTFPGNEYFRNNEGEGQENLHKICRAYSVYDEEVGYCQGMSFLAAVLLLHLPEEQAFGVFVKIMYDYNHRELFLNGFERLNQRFFILGRLTEEFLPDLHSHFLQNNVESHMYCSQWFLTLFIAKFPLSLVYRIFDLYLNEGEHVILQVALALLKVAKRDLVQLNFEGMLKYFRVSLPRRFINEEEHKHFINVVFSYKAVKKRLKKYEEEYELKKEREKENEDPVERLKRENKQLMLSNLRIEQENDSLAHELVTTKVSLREKLDEAEEQAEDHLRQLEVLRQRVPELEDENEKFRAEGARVKDILRRSAEDGEATRQRYESVIEQYKKICSKLDERSEELKSNLERELKEIKRRIGSCANCSQYFTGEGRPQSSNDDSGDNGFKTSIKIEDADQRMKELELELAQTKLSLVEAECTVQDLEHRLSSFMSAVAAEESKPWFRRAKLSTAAKK